MHKHTILEVKDDRFLYERTRSTLKSLVRGVLVDIVVPIFFRGKLDNEAMRETFLITSISVSRKKENMPRVYRTCRPSGELSFPPVIDFM